MYSALGPPVLVRFSVPDIERVALGLLAFCRQSSASERGPRDPIRRRIQVVIQSVTSPVELPFWASFSAAASMHTW